MDLPLRAVRTLLLALPVALVISTCTATPPDGPTGEDASSAREAGFSGVGQEAEGGQFDADLLGLRADLAAGLSEHTLLLSGASTALLNGRTDEYEAYVVLVNEDSTRRLADLMVRAGGNPQGAQTFQDWWRVGNELLLSYLEAGEQGAQDAQQSALDGLQAAAAGLAQTFQQITGLPAGEAQGLVRDHLAELTRMVDAQLAGDDLQAFRILRQASAAADTLARPLASAAAGEDPTVFPPQSLSVRLHLLLAEHVHLLGLATTAALNGDGDEFNAIATALVEGTAVDLANAVGSAADLQAGQAFLSDWNAHIRWVVRYTEATARGDGQGVLEALDGLTESLVAVASSLEEIAGLPATIAAAAFAAYMAAVSDIIDSRSPLGSEQPGDGHRATIAAHVSATVLEAGRELRALADPLAESIARTRKLASRE